MRPGLRHQHGLAAEEIAERAYLARGAQVLARRWRCRSGEIDLIVEEGGCLVFVEVRARRSLAEAAASLSPRKLARILGAAAAWMSAQNISPDQNMRVDAALIDRTGQIEILENATL
ncbi:MAG: YraN family protein [Pseudomonadota bacterium]